MLTFDRKIAHTVTQTLVLPLKVGNLQQGVLNVLQRKGQIP